LSEVARGVGVAMVTGRVEGDLAMVIGAVSR
jgi:hypothetical protein